MTTKSKRKGYDLEVQAMKMLRRLWPDIHRTGSMAYTKDAADLKASGLVVQCKMREKTWVGSLYRGLCKAEPHAKVRMIVTRDKNQPILVTMPLEEYLQWISLR